MMEHNVVTLETSKKLKAANFPQKAEHFWIENKVGASYVEVLDFKSGEGDSYFDPQEYADSGWTVYATPTAQEIADQLPFDGTIRVDLWPNTMFRMAWE
jgi:hypothetical protein